MSPRSRKPRAEQGRGSHASTPLQSGSAGAPAGPKSGGSLALPQIPPLVALALILAATIVLQFRALSTPFFADDYLFIDQVGRGSLIQTLTAPDPIGNFYRPVGRQLFFWLLARASRGSALAFHAANLALWLAVLGLIFAVTLRLAGPTAGLIAAGLLALHYAADVPLRWASGCQDLIAVAGALLALWLYLSGRRAWAGLALLGALLSKEVVALTPLVAVAAARRADESWRRAALRAWPLAAAVAAWLAIAWSVAHARGGVHERIGITPAAGMAALAHLFQVVAGVEWYRGLAGEIRPVAAWVASLALVLFAIAAGRHRGAPGGAAARATGTGRGIAAGLVWALAGALPIAAVADIWSAYYYLFALCGAAVALGTLLGARHRDWALIAIAVVAWNSGHASALRAYALVREPWTSCSHVNRHYLERGTAIVGRYLRQLRIARPNLPPRSTVFFGGIPGGVAFQAGDGPLLRWVYRDTSLRSYYTNSFDLEKARRGPYFFLEIRSDSLVDKSGDPNQFLRLGLGAILSDRPTAAREMLTALREQDSTSVVGRYWLAWVEWDLGDRERAQRLLSDGHLDLAAGPAPQLAACRAAMARGDTASAFRLARVATVEHPLDPEAHALLADLVFVQAPAAAGGVIEAYAARLLAARSPREWRRWAMIQIRQERPLEGAVSLRHYLDLAGDLGARDLEAQQMAAYLRNRYPVTAEALAPKPPAP